MTVVRPSHEATREEIRTVARRLFEEYGYAETSLSRIAQETGITKDQLRSYFPIKADLIWDAIDEKYQLLLTTLRQYHGTGQIAAGVRAGFRSVLDYRPAEQEEVAAGIENLDRTPELYGQAEERLAAHKHTFIKFIADEIGQKAEDYIPRLVGETVWTASQVTTRYWSSVQDPRASLSDAVDHVVAPILEAFADRLKPATAS